MGENDITASLLTKDEIGSTIEHYSEGSGSCFPKEGYNWILNTSFWSGAAYNDSDVWFLYSSGGFGYSYKYNDFDFAVRPVIIISSSLI